MTRLPQFQGRNLRLLAIVVLVTAAVLVTLAFEGALAHWNGLLPVFARETDHKPWNYGVGGRPQEKITLAASTQSRKWEGKEAAKHNQIRARELWKHVKSFADVLRTKKSPGIGDILQHFLHYAWMHWSKWYARCLDCPKIRPIQAQMSHGTHCVWLVWPRIQRPSNPSGSGTHGFCMSAGSADSTGSRLARSSKHKFPYLTHVSPFLGIDVVVVVVFFLSQLLCCGSPV